MWYKFTPIRTKWQQAKSLIVKTYLLFISVLYTKFLLPFASVFTSKTPCEIDVEIIDFEHYINIFRDTDAGMGRKCDFIIYPKSGYDFIVFNRYYIE